MSVHGTPNPRTIDVLPGRIPGCEDFVGSIVLEVMGEYELIQE